MKEEQKKVQFNLKLPKARGSKEYFDITLNDIDETTFIMASQMVRAGKDVEATKLVLKELHADGDKIEDVLNCFHAVHAAMGAVLELLTPVEVELKKN